MILAYPQKLSRLKRRSKPCRCAKTRTGQKPGFFVWIFATRMHKLCIRVYNKCMGGKRLSPATQIMNAATLPTGITYNEASLAYWVRADYFLTRVVGGWELIDMINGAMDQRFRTEAAGIAALAKLV